VEGSGRGATVTLFILGLERRHDGAMVGADAPVGKGQHVGLVLDPFARQAGANEEKINAAVRVLFA